MEGFGEVASLLKKCDTCERVAIGKDATAVVRVAYKRDQSKEQMYAVKEFRKRRKNESEKDYVKKLTSEFCIFLRCTMLTLLRLWIWCKTKISTGVRSWNIVLAETCTQPSRKVE